MVPTRSCQQILRKFVVLGNLSYYNPHWRKDCKGKPGSTGRYLGRQDMGHSRSLMHHSASLPHHFSHVYLVSTCSMKGQDLEKANILHLACFQVGQLKIKQTALIFFFFTYIQLVCLPFVSHYYEAVSPRDHQHFPEDLNFLHTLETLLIHSFTSVFTSAVFQLLKCK